MQERTSGPVNKNLLIKIGNNRKEFQTHCYDKKQQKIHIFQKVKNESRSVGVEESKFRHEREE